MIDLFSNLGKFVSFVFQGVLKLGNYLLDTFGPAIRFMQVETVKFLNVIIAGINKLGQFIKIEVKLQPFDIEEYKNALEEAEQLRKGSGIDEPVEVKTQAAAPGPQRPLNLGVNQLSGGASKAVQKEEQALEKAFEKLNETTQKLATKQRLLYLSELDKQIEQVEQKYQEQIDKAIELELKGVEGAMEARLELEALKAEEMALVRDQAFEKELEQLEAQELKRLEQELEFSQARQEAEEELKAFANEQLLSEREQELLALSEHFQELLDLADQYGLDTTQVTEAYRQQLAQINADFDKKETEQVKQAQQERLKAVADGFKGMGNVVSNFQKILEAGGKRGAKIAKTLALINILAKSGEAIANAVAAGSALPFPANLGAIATGVATVFTNVAQARALLNEAPARSPAEVGRLVGRHWPG